QPPAMRAPAPASRMLDANSPAYDLSPEPYDRRRVVGEPRPARRSEPALSAPRRSLPRAAPMTGAIAAVAVSPTATLACPLVSVLDGWIANFVHPAAMRLLDPPVV